MASFQLHVEGEPRGEPYDEPREDGLYLDEEEGCWRNERGHRVCGARIPNKGGKWRRGKNQVSEGRCRLHGGESLAGKDSPTFKNGRYSKVLPDNVAARFAEVREDSNLTDLREELALIQTRIEEVIDALDMKDSAQLWDDIEKHFSMFQTAYRNGDTPQMAEQLDVLEELVEEGAEQRAKWREVSDLIERKRKLVDSERRREKALQEYVPMEDFVMSMHTVDDILRRHIDDTNTMQEIARELRSTFDLG